MLFLGLKFSSTTKPSTDSLLVEVANVSGYAKKKCMILKTLFSRGD
jgi:hypothetical protein